MQDTGLSAYLLGLQAPWTVSAVKLDVPGQRIDIRVEPAAGVRWPCPACAERLGRYDHAAERVWRHLDSWQYHTYVHARIPLGSSVPPTESCRSWCPGPNPTPGSPGWSNAWPSMSSARVA